MPVVGLQGIKGGVGTTSMVVGLGWALKTLGEPVLMIDLSPDNLLCLHCNLAYTNPAGWAYADLQDKPWSGQAFQYCDNLNFLPYGSTSGLNQDDLEKRLHKHPDLWKKRVASIQQQHPDWWILLDIPCSNQTLSRQGVMASTHLLIVLNADGQSNALLPHFSCQKPYHFLLNRFRCEIDLQADISLLWQESLPHLLPFVVHDDSAFMDSLAKKSPAGQLYKHSLALKEMSALASWCLVNCREMHFE